LRGSGLGAHLIVKVPWPAFNCQGTSTSRQRSDLFGFRVKLPPVTTSLTTQL